MNTLEYIKKNKIIAIIRGVEKNKIYNLAKALSDGGIYCMEITFNQSGDLNETTEMIELLSKCDIKNLCIGAGTVLDINQVELAYKAGAKYIISPNTDKEVIKKTKELGMVSIPGAFSPSEIIDAYKNGGDIIKLFPAGILGIEYIKAIKAPINHIPLSLVGGVSLDNINEFIKIGVDCFGIGSNIINKDAINNDDWVKQTSIAYNYAKSVGIK